MQILKHSSKLEEGFLLQYVVSKAVEGVDMKTVRERGERALHYGPGLQVANITFSCSVIWLGMESVFCAEIQGNKFDSLQWKSKEQFKQYTLMELYQKKKPQYNFKKSWTQKNLIYKTQLCQTRDLKQVT